MELADYEKVQQSDIVPRMADMLIAKVEHVTHEFLHPPLNARAPSIDIFVQRILYASHMEPCVFLHAMAYLDRLSRLFPSGTSNHRLTPYMVLFSSLLLAEKYCYDSLVFNGWWIRYADGLFSVEQVLRMEIVLLKALDYRLRVDEDHVTAYWQALCDPKP
jgi:hypothetical protein